MVLSCVILGPCATVSEAGSAQSWGVVRAATSEAVDGWVACTVALSCVSVCSRSLSG